MLFRIYVQQMIRTFLQCPYHAINDDGENCVLYLISVASAAVLLLTLPTEFASRKARPIKRRRQNDFFKKERERRDMPKEIRFLE
jgi:hypothetical protein